MPSTPAERRALALIAAVAALGVVARVVRARDARPEPAPADVLALEAQIARVQGAREAARGGGARKARPPRASPGETRPIRRDSAPAKPKAARLPVDLDVATEAAIESLPWVGPALAARIVESRDRCGPFGSMESLTRVYGIGEGMARRLASHVTFSMPSRPVDADRTKGCQGSAKGAAPRRKGRS